MIDAPKAPKRGRHTVARHGALKSPHPIGQLAKILAICLSVVLVSGLGVAAYLAYDLTATFTADAVELEGQGAAPPPNIGEIEGGVNLFLAGTDACEPEYAGYFGKRCTGPDADSELNDVNMLVHISDEPRRVTVVSFPRDLMMPIPSCTAEDGSTTSAMSKQPLNSTFMTGGLSCAAKAVSELTGQNVQYAASVTWGGVIEITNAIGGVDVCLASGIKDPNTGLDMTAGTHNISGIQALQFLRTRYGVGDGSDLGRISNQQQYMSRLARKLVSEDVLTDPTLLLKLARTAIENIDPSTSLTNPLTLVQIALAIKDVPFEEIVFVQYPTFTDSSNANHVVPNYDAADELWAALAANQPLQLTGEAGVNDGVVVVEPTAPPVEPTTPTAEATPGTTETAAPVVEQPIALPPEISGSTAAQETCSNGNVR